MFLVTKTKIVTFFYFQTLIKNEYLYSFNAYFIYLFLIPTRITYYVSFKYNTYYKVVDIKINYKFYEFLKT